MDQNSQREQSLFEAALDFADPEQRRAFLDQACGADQVLRERIERLLALSKSADTFFNQSASALEAVAAQAGPDEVAAAAQSSLGTEPERGSQIGTYKLLQKLGEGGCGVVYMAEQEKPIRRRVALKIIKLGMDTKSVIARFEAERQALALMDHPSIARVFDAGATDTGRPFFAMELVYGVNMTDFCDQNRLGVKARLELFVLVCGAVQHAHQKGIIHRDLKPSNIMVTMHDGVPVPKVIDFGIAKATQHRLTDKTIFTAYAQMLGTPAYMSPEQMEMSGLDLDTRSDIYSLGVLLYELLMGHTPFDTAELLKSGVEELRRTVREREPLRPSARLQTLGKEELSKTARMRHVEPPGLLAQLHGDLDWIVMKCLEKDRARRYETVNGLAMDIRRYLQEEPVLARPPSRWYRLQKMVRRNRLVFTSGVAVGAALLLGSIISTRLYVEEKSARNSEAILRKEAEQREKASHIALLVTQRRFEEADSLMAKVPLKQPSIELAAELRALGDWHAANARWRQAADRFAAVDQVDQLDDPNLIASDQLKLAATLLRAGDREGYEQFRKLSVARSAPTNFTKEYWTLKGALVLPPDPNLLQTLVPGAEVVEKRFSTAEAMPTFPPHGPQWLEELALLEYRRGNFAAAAGWCYRCESYPLTSGARTATTSLIKAMSNWRMGQYQMAVVDWTAAYDLIQAKSQQGFNLGSTPSALLPGAIQPEEPESNWFDWEIAGLLLGECNDLFTQSNLALGSLPKSNSDAKGSIVARSRALGEWYATREEWQPARDCFDYVRKALPSDQGGSAQDYMHSAITALKLGDETGFFLLRDEALNKFKGATDAWTAQVVMNTVLLQATDGLSDASLEPFVKVLDHNLAGAGSNQDGAASDSAWNLMLHGLLAYRRGHSVQALDWCKRSLAVSTFVPLPTATDRVIRAMSFHQLGDDAEARPELDEARSLVQTGLNYDFDKWHWREWAFVRLLLDEASGLISQPPLPASSAHPQ